LKGLPKIVQFKRWSMISSTSTEGLRTTSSATSSALRRSNPEIGFRGFWYTPTLGLALRRIILLTIQFCWLPKGFLIEPSFLNQMLALGSSLKKRHSCCILAVHANKDQNFTSFEE